VRKQQQLPAQRDGIQSQPMTRKKNNRIVPLLPDRIADNRQVQAQAQAHAHAHSSRCRATQRLSKDNPTALRFSTREVRETHWSLSSQHSRCKGLIGD
jgi:hypothetical protein